MVRHFDDLSRKAHAELLDLRKPAPLPADLLAARDEHEAAAARLTTAQSTERRADRRLQALSAERPSGLLAWLTGATRAHDRRVESAEGIHDRASRDTEFASIKEWATQARLSALETQWLREGRNVEADRDQRRRDLQDDLAWIADAKTVLAVHPDLTHAAQAEFASAVDKLRAERGRHAAEAMWKESAPLGVVRIVASPGYRPR